MPNLPPPCLTQTRDRARAATVIRAATNGWALDAFRLAETLDTTSAAILRSAGLDDDTSRAILTALWCRPPAPDIAANPPTTAPTGKPQRERDFLRDLGQRIHVIRRARKLTPTDIRRRTGVAPSLLDDIENGRTAPTALTLSRLARALGVPLPMFVDDRVTPLRVLQLLTDHGAA